MKYLIFCAILAVVTAGIDANLFAVGLRVSFRVASNATCGSPISGPQCSADCSALLVCAAGVSTPLQTTPCSSPKQYCVNNACTSTPSPNCPSGPSFVCTSDGIFPEPQNCTQYRLCASGNATLYECPSGFIFNSNVGLCEKGTARTIVPTVPCTTIDCSKSPNTFIAYTSNPAYYAYCAASAEPNGPVTTYMFVCQYPEFQIFDLPSKVCIFNCKAKGYFQDPANCSGYYYCSAAKAKPTLLSCPGTYVFDGTECNALASKCQYPPPA